MKKLDEIMELMADEMADFKVSILKLDLLSKKLNKMSIPISTAAIDENLKSFLQKQEEADELKNELFRDINIQLERASLIPNYILVLFGSILILLLSGLGYFIYSSKITEGEKFWIYRTISESKLESYQIFFSENLEIKEGYCNWLEQWHK
ncbi:hypothetical protein E0K83_09170 [Gramella sp. BOM4]|uniref:DUF6730 family protein n=1 Tax=Christiangramia sp. TaxID=1931228 RepID=UPI0012E18F0C|nr:DUF6730 family protein [Christiangramia sp.]MUP45916.1 hypothetical protein [Christiangramia bathymodioli]